MQPNRTMANSGPIFHDILSTRSMSMTKQKQQN